MDNNKYRAIAIHLVLAVLLGFSLMLALACSNKSSPKEGMEINGAVTDYRDNAPAKGVEVRLYTYHLNPVIQYLPPTGHILNTAITDEEGKYKLEISPDLLIKLEEQGYSKVVVYVAQGMSGFRVVDVADGTIIVVDLVIGSPAPSAAK